MSETNAPMGQWESIKKNFAESVIKMFPISGRKNVLEIQEVSFDESKADPQDIRAREIAKHQEKTWGIPVFAKFTLRDKATGQVINESKQKLAVLPRLTPLDTYIVSGGEWNSAYQWRLKSGIYAKITDAGKLETEFNLNGAGKDFARESRLKIPFDPETKQFKFKYGTVSAPLYSILKANDVSDDTMKKAWGDDIFNANFKKNWQQDVTKLYNTKLKKRGLLAESDSFEHIKSAIVKEFNKAEVLPETTKLTIGKEVKNLDGDALLAGSTHILGVSRGNKPDDVYSLYFKHLLGLDDFIAEKFGASKTAQAIKSKIRNTLDKKEKVSQILANDLFSKPLSQVFIGNTLSQRPDQVNPIDILSSKSITTITGPGGISSSHAIRNPMKIISQSHLAMLDPILTPESESTGITLHLPIGAKKVGREAQTLVYDLLHKKFKHINPAELHGSYTVLPDQIKWKGGVPQPIAKENGNGKVTAVDPLTHEFTEVPLEKARYVLPSPRNFFSEATNLIPFLQCNQGNRTMTGSRQPAQGVALKYKEAPLVQVRSNDPTKSFEHVFGQKFSHQSPADGKVVAVVKDNLGYTNEIHVEDKTGKVHKTQIYNNFPLNDKKAFLHADPVVEVGQTVTRGQQIADSNFSDKGTLAVGTNLHVGYMPYGAFTFEDGIVVSESGAKKLTSEHLHKTSLELDPKNDKVSLSKFISHISSVGKKLKKDKVANLDENGIIKPGSIVKPGDLLVTAISKNTIEGQLASMASKMKGATSAYKDKSLVWDHDYEGKVVKVIPKPGNNGYTVYVRTSEPAKIGDKICYDEETEVLTSTGWKFVKDVSLEDEVCTLNPSTDHIEYHSPTQLHYYPTGGEMYYVENSNLNFFVTTDHNMYVKKRGKKTFEFVPARELVGKRVSYKKNGIWKGSSPEKVVFPELEVKAGQFGHGVRTLPKLEMPTKSFMFLLGAFLSEGNCLNQPKTGSYGIEITQIKPAFRAKLINMLEEQNLTFGVTEEKIRIFSKQLLMYFKQFGKCHQKYIPQEVFLYAKEDLEVLFEWLMWGDGTSINGRPVCYYSTSKQLADDVQKLALHIGKAANLQLGTPAKVQTIKGKQYNCRDCWDVRIINTKLEPTVNHGHVRTQNVQQEYVVQNYEKPVYCLTVQNHVIYTRRLGRPSWSANCGRSGDKNIIGAIIPDEHMPRVGGKDGQIFDLLTAPSGVVSRINLGQLLEMGASKIAKKTGQPYVTTNFAPGVDYTEKIKKEMAAHGISDTDRVYDPLLGKEVEGDVLTGYKYIIKQKHQVEKKESVRGLDQALSGKYSTNFDPQRGKGEGAQAISPLDLYALLGHGARANLKEMSSYKAELQHDTATGMHTDGDFWNRVMLGMPLKPPKPTFAYRKFEGYLTGLGINLKKEGNTTVLTPLTDKGVLALSNGEIKEADQIRGKDDQEIKGGLFDPKITGGIADAPGKGMHWSHLKLAEPYPNPIFVGTLHLPGPAAVLSGLPFKQFEQVAKGQEDIVVNGKSLTGGKAIEEILKKVNVKKDLESIKKQLPLLKGSELNKANKKAKFLQALDRLNMRPEEAYIMNHVPILPPVFRPITVLPDGSSTSADANTLYKSLILLNNGLKEKEVLRNFPDKEKELRSSTYDALKALIGLGKVPSYDGNKKLKGLLQTVAGDSPKTGFFQSKVMKRRQELSMRSTIIPGPDMGIDQIGLPKNAAMELYKPFVIRELVRSGKDLIEATKDVKEGTSMAWKALDNAIKNRPVLVKRDPVLHKYNVQALLPKLIEGSAIAMHPLLASAYNFDHDGNCFLGNSEILLKIGYNNSVDDPKQLLQEKYQMKFTKTTRIVATTPNGALVSLNIEDMPRYEEGKILDKNGAWIYPVPSDISVWSYDHKINRPVFAPITGITVEHNCPTVNVETRRFKVTASPNESLCVYNHATQQVEDICPKDAIGRLCPVVTQIPNFGTQGNTEFGWLLGAFVSDGSISGRTITCTKVDKQYRDRFYAALCALQAEPVTRHSYEEYHDETCSVKGMSAKDHFGNICKETLDMFKSCYSEEEVEGRSCLRKQIPNFIGSLSREALVGLLSGLFDGDGSLSVSHSKKKLQPIANFATSSKYLVNSVELLCKLLNIRTSTSSSEPKEGRLQTHTSYLVSLSINDLACYADELTVLGEKRHEAIHLLKSQERRDIVDIVPVPTFVMNLVTTANGPMKGHELFRSLGTIKSARKAGYYISRDTANIIFSILADANVRHLEKWKEIIDATNVHWDLVVSVTDNVPDTVYDLVVPSTKVFAVNGGLIVWDTMAVHLPLTEQARQEALDKMLPSSNLFSATNYGIMHAPDQEAIIGINNLSHWGQKKELSFNSLADLKKNKDIKVSDVVKVKIGSEYKETTKGRALLVENAPLEMDHSKLLHDPSLELKKSSIHKMLETFARKDPKGYPTLVDDWRKKGNERAHEMGFSFSLSDLNPLKAKRSAILAPYHDEVAKVNKSSLSQDNKDAKIVALYNKATEELDEKLSKDYKAMGNNMFKMVDTKARGSLAQFRQTVIAPMLLVDANNKVITTPVLNSYSEGLNVSQYWTSLHGARKGTLQRAQGTSVPGALAKELINLNIATPITKHDCGDEHGLEMKLVDKKGNNEIDVTDRFLAKDEHGFHKGTLITPEVFGKLKANNVTSVTVRSPLTCKVPQGICSTCFGLNENGHKHEIGTNIGVLASQALSEPAVQLAMDCSADGNLVSVKVNGFITTLTFEQLWSFIPGFVYEDDGIETKMPIDLKVWDHDKWVEVITFQRHKVDEPMVLVRTSSGRSFIVKATHPSWAKEDTMEIENGVFAAKDLLNKWVPVSSQQVDTFTFNRYVPVTLIGLAIKKDIELQVSREAALIKFNTEQSFVRSQVIESLAAAKLSYTEQDNDIVLTDPLIIRELELHFTNEGKLQLPMGFLGAPLQWKTELLESLVDFPVDSYSVIEGLNWALASQLQELARNMYMSSSLTSTADNLFSLYIDSCPIKADTGYDKVTSLEPVLYDGWTYDFSTATKSYTTNGITTHNSFHCLHLQSLLFVRNKGKDFVCDTLENLFDTCSSSPYIEGDEEVKDLVDMEVFADGKWIALTHVKRHKPTSPMVLIGDGHNINIAQDTHPMFVFTNGQKDVKELRNIIVGQDVVKFDLTAIFQAPVKETDLDPIVMAKKCGVQQVSLPNDFLSYSVKWLMDFTTALYKLKAGNIELTNFQLVQQLSMIFTKLNWDVGINSEDGQTFSFDFYKGIVKLSGQRLVQTIKPVLYTDDYVYDVTTEDHSLIIGGLLTHNSGGVAQSRGGGSSSKLERLSQLLNLPKGLPYSATLAKQNGVIHSVEKDTAGGHKVYIQNNTGVHEHYVPSTLDLIVDKGHEVKRGEAISNGPINPHQLLQLKDMGAVRKYLTTEMGDMYKDVGGVRRRNVEVVVKNLTNLTEVVSSGSSDHLPGDILSTAIVDAHNRSVHHENRILHKPILRGIKETALLKDEDYLSKMNFQRIQNTVIEGVGKGWKTTTKDTLSPLPAWAAGTIDIQKDKNNPKY